MPSLTIGTHVCATRYFLAPLAGYTQLPFRRVVRRNGGVGWCTTDLVQAMHLVRGTPWARELVRTSADDAPLAVQIYGGVIEHLVAAAQWLEREGYAAVDINMGCPMAKMVGTGGGARLMCRVDSAVGLVRSVVEAVRIPVSVKMRLGWDRQHLTAPTLAREFEQAGVVAITIHGRTREQGFRGTVDLAGIRAVVHAVERIPVVGNGDVRTVDDAFRMRRETDCAAVAIGRGALYDPWIFRRIAVAERGEPPFLPTADEQLQFLRDHFAFTLEQFGETTTSLTFRKFAAWYGAQLGIPEDLEDRLRRLASVADFEAIAEACRDRCGTRLNPRPTQELRVPNGPIEHW